MRYCTLQIVISWQKIETLDVDNFTDLILGEKYDNILDLPLLGASSDRDLISDQQSDSSSLLSFEAPIFSPIQLQL